jgi:flagellar biosynthesis protein FlhF
LEVDVKIKRYIAASMRAALSLVRAEQGPDAVILSSRRVNEGIEVIAAVDYDEALIAGAARRYTRAADASSAVPAASESVPAPTAMPASSHAAATVPPRSAPVTPRAATVTPRAATATPPAATVTPRLAVATTRAALTPRTIPAPPSVKAASTSPIAPPQPAIVRTAKATHAPREATATAREAPRTASAAAARSVRQTVAPAPRLVPTLPVSDEAQGLALMQRELKDMRMLLESGLANLSWQDRRQREPLRTSILEELSSMDIAPDVAAALAAQTPSRTDLKDSSKLPLALLLRHLPVVENLSTVGGGVIAVVGPTGAGKTTTIAKLAARWAIKHGSDDLALVSTDPYRIGAREELMTHARRLGAAIHAPNSGRELARVLERCKSKRLVLIDTAGMGPRDIRLAEQLAALKEGAASATVLLALPAHGEVHALEDIIRAFSGASPAACIITKVDESASLGAVISATVRHKLKIAFVCNGQRVPDDLHAAYLKRAWLIWVARKLTERAPPRSEAYLARHFGRGVVHA